MDMKITKEEEGVWFIKPIPGYVCKWKDVKIGGIAGEETLKCFVNVCHCEQLPPPMDDLSEEDIAKLFDIKDEEYKIPISVGEIDCVKDRKEENSVKIDILVNSTFYAKRLSSPEDTFFRHLLCLIFCDIIKNKHSIDLDPMKAIVLRNRVSVGDLEVQKVLSKPESRIVEEVLADDFKRQTELEEKRKTERKHIDDGEVLQEVKNAMFGMRPIEGVRVRLFDGKRLEISIRCEVHGNIVKDPRRLSLKINPTRCLVILDRSQSMFDFSLPLIIDPTTAKSKFVHDKYILVFSADIVLSR